ncbi:hypothetical protein [Tritonibacter scottomollicae]|uniref:Uncharacterized protein n=1 Tax=Tritonibacter scottomollicae TaxID=483013 RepID=A0ABZ0HNF4_TRISK|nr:hypothetical protein [Tritonibacter scottomollicae]WOI35416.1 hypothetical protein R1T40_22000 [Tritonibacter scottomollicae]
MRQLKLIPMSDGEKGKPGAQWWDGAYQCRNFEGYFQKRKQGRGPWKFDIEGVGFDGISAYVYRVREDGELEEEKVPIDDQDRITVNGRKYGSKNWEPCIEFFVQSVSKNLLRDPKALFGRF